MKKMMRLMKVMLRMRSWANEGWEISVDEDMMERFCENLDGVSH